MTWGVGGQAPPFRPTDPDPGGPRGPRMAPPCRLRELGRVFQAPGLPEGPSSRPHAPHPAPLAGAWMGSGPDPWDTAFLGQLFGKKKKKIISDSLWGDLPQSRLLGVVGFAGSGAPRKEAGERLPGYRWV